MVLTALLAAAGLPAIWRICRAGDASYVRVYLVLLYLQLSAGLWTGAGPAAGVRHYVFYYCFALLIVSLLSISGRQAWLVRIPATFLGLLSLIVSAVFLGYALTNRSMLEEAALNAVYQTDPREAAGYVATFIGPLNLAGVIGLLLASAVLLFWLQPLRGRGILRAEYTGLLVVSALLAWETRGASNEWLVVSSALRYYTAINGYREIAARASPIAVVARYARKGPETHVVVIGESTNRNHMGLYGYFRDTTPGLSKLAPELVVLTDAISCDRYTEAVLDRALTSAAVDSRLGFGDPAVLSLNPGPACSRNSRLLAQQSEPAGPLGQPYCPFE
jgi:glucan phosphoethanolaminetransferase (alkaline phosphatase superfamily)